MFRIILLLLICSNSCHGLLRKYYLAAEDKEWDYAPTNKNVITGREVEQGSLEGKYLIGGPDRIGRKYGKAVFVGYTDETFTDVVPKSDWQGLLGPIISGEVGDTIQVLFKNLASRSYSLHTHGMLYDKGSEGAKYEDDTSVRERLDDSVPPGSNHTYTWRVDEISGPAEGDTNCIAWPYHTHIETPYGTNTGLIGASLICRPGTLDENGRRTDVDKDIVLLVTVIDENVSYYLYKNVKEYCGDPERVDPDDADFVESNWMHSVNGYVYGNLPGLEMCQGDRVAWHVFSMGTEKDLHTLYFHGNSLNIRGHRRDAFSTSPAYFLTGEMDALNPGTWLMTSEVNTHMLAGTQALYKVDSGCSRNEITERTVTTNTRKYFIQAEEDLWDYAPSGVDGFDGISLTDPNSPAYPFFVNNSQRICGTYKKARYFQYTDANFTTKVEPDTTEQHLGFLGPIIRAEVGDEVLVTFRNGANRNYSILVHGVMYDKANEGSGYEDGTSGSDKDDDAIPPGDEHTYRWTVPEHYGPTNRDEECLTWLYYSAVDPERDVYSGLVGPLLVCRPGTLDDNGKRKGVFEFHILMMTVDENRSWYINDNIEMFTDLDPDDALNDDAFITSNTMEAINGYSFGNLPGLNEICQGRDVSWHMSTLGGDTDQHTIYFRGHTVTVDNRRTDTVSLTPGNSVTSRMVPKKKGIWAIECMTGSHFVNGMKALYTVHSGCAQPTGQSSTTIPKGVKRTYYIGATEINWDFVPIKIDPVRNQSLLDEDSPGNIFVKKEGPFMGSVYKKAVYRQYTDETFMDEVPIGSDEKHLNILGPMLHAEVGDQLEVVFKNMASREYSIHPHGVMYNKSSEVTRDHIVQPGETYTYIWNIPPQVGPSEGDGDCILYAYYSDTDRVRDLNAGLIGPLIICSKGTLGSHGRRVDVDREFVLLFNVFDENQSWYLDDNIEEFAPRPDLVDKEDPDFQESNLMHGMNGLLYGNLKHLEMYLGETVEWYLIGIGEEVDIHTVHFHGQPVIYQQWTKHRIDVLELFPGIFSTVQMKVKEVGNWLLHCHVNDHILGGMEAIYNVMEFKITSTDKQPVESTTAIGDPITTHHTTAGYTPTGYCLVLLITNLAVALFNLYECIECHA